MKDLTLKIFEGNSTELQEILVKRENWNIGYQTGVYDQNPNTVIRICLLNKGKIVGLSVICPFLLISEYFLFLSLRVDEDYRRRGLSKKLMEATFEYALQKKKGVKIGTPYTEDGEKYLHKNIIKTSQKYPEVPFIDCDKI